MKLHFMPLNIIYLVKLSHRLNLDTGYVDHYRILPGRMKLFPMRDFLQIFLLWLL